MENINGGGPAFPSETKDLKGDYNRGMSLRDYFAGQALVGFLACDDFLIVIKENQTYEGACADKAYEYADAMLKGRANGKTQYSGGAEIC